MLYMDETSYIGDFKGGLRNGFGMQVYSGRLADHVDVLAQMGPEYLGIVTAPSPQVQADKVAKPKAKKDKKKKKGKKDKG